MVIALAILSGIALPIGMFFPSVWYVSVLGCVPLAHLLGRPETRARPFMIGWLFGAVYSGASIIWFWNILPLDWLDVVTPLRGILLVLSTWLIVSIVLGVFFGVFAAMFVRLKRGDVADAFTAASLWTLIQYAQMWGFAFLTIGGPSLFGAHFSPPMVGYALAWYSPLLQAASVGGVYGLTFIVIAAGFLLHFVLSRATRLRVRIGVVVIAFITLAALTRFDQSMPVDGVAPGGRSVEVALVSTDFQAAARSPEDQRRRGAAQLDLVQSWMPNRAPDILVFPEGADFFGTTGQDPVAFLTSLGSTTSIIDSAPASSGAGRSLRMFLYDARGTLAGTYDKLFLVPQGEYTPFLYAFLQRLIGGEQFSRTVAQYRTLERGNSLGPTLLGDATIGGLFCSDILSPGLYRNLTRNGAELLVNTASQAMFHGSRMADTMTLSMAKVRAVENGRYLVMAGNIIPSMVISNAGRLVTRAPLGASVIAADVPLLNHRTPYTRFGELVLIAPLMILAATSWRNMGRMLRAGIIRLRRRIGGTVPEASET